jgi:methylenetetrahydrofolate dehydrogenase (NADP+)/methenyltetrahydrofolate cyclohydrolase
MKIIDGKTIAAAIREEIRQDVAQMQRKPALAVVIVGEDPASQIYVRNKVKACGEIGINSYVYTLPTDCSQEALEAKLDELATDKGIDGILLQLPLPKHLDTESAMARIPFEKDVDGFSERNLGLLALHKEKMVACTPLGVMKLLEAEGVQIAGKHAVILGRIDTVGKPMAMLLLNADATVTVCHSKTKNIKQICLQANILVAAIGKAKFVKEDMVKEGAIVIDVGINRDEDGKLCGDVDFESVKQKASLITPVPGGVGPMTIAMLMQNTCLAAKNNG